MDRLLAMQVFVRVVETGGFTRAADLLNMPKATVTTLVQGLEARLGVKLLNRTTRRVNVTSDGAAYYERCVRILADVEDTENVLSRSKSSPHGRLRIDVSGAFGRRLLIPALPEFIERYPDIRLEIGCSDRSVDLVEEGVDCVVRGGEQPDSNLVARKLGLIDFVTCAAPSYLERYGVPAHPCELASHRLITYFSARTGRLFEWVYARGDERIEVSPSAHTAFNDSEAMFIAALAGLGVVQAAEVMAREAIERGRLVRFLGEWQIEPLPLYVMYHQNRHLSAKVRAFTEWVADMYERRRRELLAGGPQQPHLAIVPAGGRAARQR
jgi:LysR family transcriptional regulator for bpeEF and oprC